VTFFDCIADFGYSGCVGFADYTEMTAPASLLKTPLRRCGRGSQA
jgi:hypothetical protein